MVLVGVFTATLTTILVGKEERAQAEMQNEVLKRIQNEGARTEEAIHQVAEQQKEINKRFDQIEKKIEAQNKKGQSD